MNFKTLRRTFFAATLSALALCAFTVNAQPISEGKEYKRIKPQPTDSGNKVEVIEFFSFGCAHCKDLEPHLEGWLKKIPPDVVFKRVPVAFQPSWEGLSKAYFTLENLNVPHALMGEVFKAVHVEGKKMQEPNVFFDWAAAKGLDRKKVEDVYKSFSINSKLNRAKSMVGPYGIDGVPTLVVNGTLVTGPGMLNGSHAGMPDALDQLVAIARKEKK